jgi:hypothetical protein
VVDVIAQNDRLASVGFGYGSPTDTNGDGVADTLAGSATLLGTQVIDNPSWGVFSAELLFYDLDSDPNFQGFRTDLYISIDDQAGGDFDLDAVQLIAPVVVTPSQMTCYKIRRAARQPEFEQRTLTLKDEFGEQTVVLIKPDLLCVPSSQVPGDGN